MTQIPAPNCPETWIYSGTGSNADESVLHTSVSSLDVAPCFVPPEWGRRYSEQYPTEVGNCMRTPDVYSFSLPNRVTVNEEEEEVGEGMTTEDAEGHDDGVEVGRSSGEDGGHYSSLHMSPGILRHVKTSSRAFLELLLRGKNSNNWSGLLPQQQSCFPAIEWHGGSTTPSNSSEYLASPGEKRQREGGVVVVEGNIDGAAQTKRMRQENCTMSAAYGNIIQGSVRHDKMEKTRKRPREEEFDV
ncbi:hypothetical protein ERJ75_000681800 [Trypanosoma vivax]|uniref:Uncharacterized protein n=1 Tax=Trypanosoma vivax (strain Y486) TaxID=1055687 RepID=G0U5N1_TRYVY|nr:hypothetical protein ERJ75_000681800 [Trypanosoma vivax]CCC51182.1 hypothetical protein TVY486_1002350 [Trypanosoma vivax Y486]